MTTTIVDRRNGISEGVAIKLACRVATTANIALSGLQTIDGVALAADDRVLVKSQTDASENGVYVAASGAWERSPDFDGSRDVVPYTRVFAVSGSAASGEYYISTTGDIVIGTTELTFTAVSIGASIPNDAVTFAKIQNVSATDRILGRITSGAGDIEELTGANVRTIINVEDGADVTDATNVDAAGAVMNADTSTAAMQFVVDEDNMASDSATKVPTQQSVKAYVDAEVAGASSGDMLAATYDPQNVADDAFDVDNHTDGTTNKVFSATEKTKLAGIETSADVTDATNVAAAGAVMESDTSTASMSFVVDEDNMSSDSATKIPTQQSVKAYVDAAVLAGGGYTDEQAQDTIGAILTDTATVDLAYDDDAPSITATVKDGSITYAKMQDVSATSRILGRITSGAGDTEELTPANVRTIINVEDGADVTDATNVAAAGAVMEADTSTASMSFVIDEDDMTSDSATKVPTQQSVKAYVDAEVAGVGGASAMPKGHLHGLTITRPSTSTITVAAGEARDGDNGEDMTLAASITKSIASNWAVGDTNGGLDTGSAANQWYYVWLIKRTDTDVVDVLISGSSTSPTVPANYDKKRRIGCILRESGNLVDFVQVDDWFSWLRGASESPEINTTQSTTRTARTLPRYPAIAGYVKVRVLISNASDGVHLDVHPIDLTDPDWTSGNANLRGPLLATQVANKEINGETVVRMTTARQLYTKASAATTTIKLVTVAFMDTRGKDA